MWNTPFYMR